MRKDKLIELLQSAIRSLMLAKAAYKPNLAQDLTRAVDSLRTPELLGPLEELFGTRIVEVLDSIDKGLTLGRSIFEKAETQKACKCDEIIGTIRRVLNSNMALMAISVVV